MGLTPMMQQYVDTKKEYSDCILFYRLGDFYEMFFEDALTVSRELELTLTGKACGLEERAPMCGVPHHSAQTYITRLVERGYKVAICEQMEDPKEAKGLVKREVVRIVTPGTNQDLQGDAADENRYLACALCTGTAFALTMCDVTTGRFILTLPPDAEALLDEIRRYAPAELLLNNQMVIQSIGIERFCQKQDIPFTELNAEYFDPTECRDMICRQFQVGVPDGLGLTEQHGIMAVGATLRYLGDTQRSALGNILSLEIQAVGEHMLIDGFTVRNLELVETMRDAKKRGSLFWVLDKTKTAMGARFLRGNLLSPLYHKARILKRYDAVEELLNDRMMSDELREYLSGIYDMERLVSKVTYGHMSPRDLLSLGNSLSYLAPVKALLAQCKVKRWKELYRNLDELEDVRQLIADSIREDSPLTLRDGGVIREGYDARVDELREASCRGKDWLLEIETRERERTGIKNLRVKYNKNFGYCLEVSKGQVHLVPEDYIRRQTLTTGERYTIADLKEVEGKILGAEERLYQLELELFEEIRQKIAANTQRILKTAGVIAETDFLQSMAQVAYQNGYVRPELTDTGELTVVGGRHPVVEQMLERDDFIANDVHLDMKNERIAIITGPNMSGKSTYMRQVALIVLMAQAGSFVPADKCRIGLTDRIFTRVGASDDLASGQSTFMVEMTEVANILHHATPKSLLILDEIGRGTSTFDGLSLAWAIVEYIADDRILGAKTLFATHYHELTELEGKIPRVVNYFIDVHENNDNVVFLRKILRGGADKSYGIQVAKLAGVPNPVIERAKELAAELDQADVTKKISAIAEESAQAAKQMHRQMTLFDLMPVAELQPERIMSESVMKAVEELRESEPDNMTPREALEFLYRLREKVKHE